MTAPDLAAAATVIDLASQVVDAAVGRLAATSIDDNQVLAYDVAHAASAVATAKGLLDYGAKGDAEGAITCAFVADAVADLAGKVFGREAEWGVEAGALDGARDFIGTYKAAEFLASITDPGPRHLDGDFEMVQDTFRRFADQKLAPIAEHIQDDRFRIYFSCRDEENRSAISWIEIDLKEPTRVLAESIDPVLLPGEDGFFDDNGCSIGCILPVGGKRYLYYMGWHLTVRVPWQNTLGLAISDGPGQPFRRWSRFPMMPLDESDPYTISYPWVINEGGLFRMWYGSNIEWGRQKGDMRHLIKYAESRDGIVWRRGDIAIDFGFPGEYAMCKPCVIKDGSTYKMWFCSRGDTYRIRYAESDDGIKWRRIDDKASIDVSSDGWDSEMIEYPCVFDHAGKRYLLYSGNGYGRAGFGIAVAESG